MESEKSANIFSNIVLNLKPIAFSGIEIRRVNGKNEILYSYDSIKTLTLGVL